MKARHEFFNKEQYEEYLRTYFAAMAMQGMLVNYVNHGHYGNSTEYPMVSEQAVFAADALINALNDKQ